MHATPSTPSTRLAARLRAATAALAFAAMAATASAQYPGGGTPGGGLLGRPATHPGDAASPRPKDNSEDQLEFRMVQLHTELKLSPVQDMAWGAFADKVKAMVADIAREHERAFANASLNSLKQIDQATDSLRNRLTALEDIGGMARLLYNGLTPEQRALADPRLAIIVHTALRVEGAGSDQVPSLGLEPAPAPPPKEGKLRFGPPPVADPSRRD